MTCSGFSEDRPQTVTDSSVPPEPARRARRRSPRPATRRRRTEDLPPQSGGRRSGRVPAGTRTARVPTTRPASSRNSSRVAASAAADASSVRLSASQGVLRVDAVSFESGLDGVHLLGEVVPVLVGAGRTVDDEHHVGRGVRPIGGCDTGRPSAETGGEGDEQGGGQETTGDTRGAGRRGCGVRAVTGSDITTQ